MRRCEAALAARRAGAIHDSGIRLLVESVLPALEGFDPTLPLDAQMLMAVEHTFGVRCARSR